MQDASPREYFKAFRAHWLSAMTGGFSVPFGAFSAFSATTYGQLLWGALAVGAFVFASYRVWAVERRKVLALTEQLAPKMRLFLHYDAKEGVSGVEFAEGPHGQSYPYVQVSVDAITDLVIENPQAHLVRVDHRSNDSEFFLNEIMGETQIAGWSRQPKSVHLSKGNPVRFNIFSYTPGAIFDSCPHGSFRLKNAYDKIGMTGEYRYQVHVDAPGVVAARAFVFVKWTGAKHPTIRLEPIA